MNGLKDLTVIIPCYRCKETILETLNCLEDKINIICIDDYSNDGTLEILMNWRKTLPNLRKVIKHSENKGLGASRNRGVSECKTEWVMFLDSDDIISSDFFDDFNKKWMSIKTSSGWCYHPYLEWNDLDKKERLRKTDTIKENHHLVTKRMPFSASGSIFHKSLVETIGGFDTDRNLEGTEDLDLYMRLFNSGIKPFQWSKTPYTKYRTNKGMTKDVRQHGSKVLLRTKRFQESGWISSHEFDLAKKEIWRQIARTEHKRGDFKEAREFYKKSGNRFSCKILYLLAFLKVKL
tara:strand:- start:7624 stop:8499 length:876 start_codon:yes stop_codon:yes gene_type:complete